MAGRKLGDPYDPTLNKLSVNQDQMTKSAWEAAGAIKQAAESDDKLEPIEILNVAIKHAPDAFSNIVQMIKDNVPLGEDITNVGWGFQNQLKPFRKNEPA